jgi:hypothetical protein
MRKVPADLGIPERTPVVASRVNPAGIAEVALKEEETSVVTVWLMPTPAVADTVRLEVKAGSTVAAWTVTAKLPVAVFPVRELIALNPSVKVPVMSAPGASVMTPVTELREAQLGREVTTKEFAPLFAVIW